MRGETQGTETSKYLEEKKEKSIPLVAASEKGGAQTRLVWGCRTAACDLQAIVELHEKADHRE